MKPSEAVAELEAEAESLRTEVKQLRCEVVQARAALTRTHLVDPLADRVWNRLTRHQSGFCVGYGDVRVVSLDFLRIIIASETQRRE